MLVEEGPNLFFCMELSFRSLVTLLAVADLAFQSPLVLDLMVGSTFRRYFRGAFDVFYFPTVVEHIAALLRFPRLWSLLLVETAILVIRSGEIS